MITCIWLFRHKYKFDGTLERHKARLVMNDKAQPVRIDCKDTFSSVVKPTTIRTVLSIAMGRNWSISQLDVKNAFLHGHLKDPVYMRQPLGLKNLNAPNHVCLL